MNTIQSSWESYQAQVMPKDAPDVQVIETRRAFYAGCQTILGIMYGIGDDSISEDAGIQMIETLHQECQLFLSGIKRGDC
jgi:hypothetical protein